MRRQLLLALITAFFVASASGFVQAGPPLASGGSDGEHGSLGSLFFLDGSFTGLNNGGDGFTATGDMYNAAPTVQGGVADFASSTGSGPLFTFDGTDELHGSNLFGAAGDQYWVREMETDMGGGQLLIQTEIIALDSSSMPTIWVESGRKDSENNTLTSFRMDVGTVFLGGNGIKPDTPWSLISSGFAAFDSLENPLDVSSSLFLAESNDDSGLSASAVFVPVGGGDIAGFDLMSIQVSWTVQFIPEPGAFVVLTTLGVGLLARRRRR